MRDMLVLRTKVYQGKGIAVWTLRLLHFGFTTTLLTITKQNNSSVCATGLPILGTCRPSQTQAHGDAMIEKALIFSRDRKSVVEVTSVSVRVDLGGLRIL